MSDIEIAVVFGLIGAVLGTLFGAWRMHCLLEPKSAGEFLASRPVEHRPPPPPPPRESAQEACDKFASKLDKILATAPKARPARQGAPAIQVIPADATGIVLTYPGFLEHEQRRAIKALVEEAMERTPRVIVLEGGITLTAVFAARGETVDLHEVGNPNPVPMPKPGTTA